MSGGRRFVNLVAWDSLKGIYSLRRFDLSRNQFFYATPEELSSHGSDMRLIRRDHLQRYPFRSDDKKRSQEQQDLAASQRKKMGAIRLPAPLASMRPTPCLEVTVRPSYQHRLHCFPLSETDMLFADSAGQVLCYDAEHRCSVTMPGLGARKEDPLSVVIPPDGGGIGSVYVIEKTLWPDRSSQFEALVSKRCFEHFPGPWRTWQRHELPLPPYVSEPGYEPYGWTIRAAAVVDNRVICISAGTGTYCFDTSTGTWSRAGDWSLPFGDKAEHVPELGLWFGPSAHNPSLPCAADLTAVVQGKPPERSLVWGDAHHMPEEWLVPCSLGSTGPRAKMVSLGSGRFCVVRLFETRAPCRFMVSEDFTDRVFAVFTGLEVVGGEGGGGGGGTGSGKKKGGRLRMVKHKSRLFKIHPGDLLIVSMF